MTNTKNQVVKSFENGAFITKTKNGWHSLIIPNEYGGYWAIHTSRKIDGCIEHNNARNLRIKSGNITVI